MRIKIELTNIFPGSEPRDKKTEICWNRTKNVFCTGLCEGESEHRETSSTVKDVCHVRAEIHKWERWC